MGHINYFDILSASLCSIRLSTRVWMTKGNRVRRIRNFLAARAVEVYCSIFFHRTKPLTPLRTRAWFSRWFVVFSFRLGFRRFVCPSFFFPPLCRERERIGCRYFIYIYIDIIFNPLSFKKKEFKIWRLSNDLVIFVDREENLLF